MVILDQLPDTWCFSRCLHRHNFGLSQRQVYGIHGSISSERVFDEVERIVRVDVDLKPRGNLPGDACWVAAGVDVANGTVEVEEQAL